MRVFTWALRLFGVMLITLPFFSWLLSLIGIKDDEYALDFVGVIMLGSLGVIFWSIGYFLDKWIPEKTKTKRSERLLRKKDIKNILNSQKRFFLILGLSLSVFPALIIAACLEGDPNDKPLYPTFMLIILIIICLLFFIPGMLLLRQFIRMRKINKTVLWDLLVNTPEKITKMIAVFLHVENAPDNFGERISVEIYSDLNKPQKIMISEKYLYGLVNYLKIQNPDVVYEEKEQELTVHTG